MFRKTRIKLTILYLIIIMLISMLFSFFIYNYLTGELNHIEDISRFRLERQRPFLPDNVYQRALLELSAFDQAEQRIFIILILINVGILVGSGALGYFLSGKTLKPIKEMLEEQNRFITDASHELRTPLTSLKSEIEVYMRAQNHSLKDADDVLKSNLEEVNNLQSLSDNLIQLAQYQNSNTNDLFTKVSVKEIITQAIKKYQKAAKLKSINLNSDVKAYYIAGNEDNLIQLIGIFLDNAIKYSGQNSTVNINARKTNHQISISISDQGIGIDKKDIPFIFGRFYRSDASRSKQSFSGYGLGLSIAKKIIENHNGSIALDSKPGKGSTFMIRLPAIS